MDLRRLRQHPVEVEQAGRDVVGKPEHAVRLGLSASVLAIARASLWFASGWFANARVTQMFLLIHLAEKDSRRTDD